jgi:hypothetical protein
MHHDKPSSPATLGGMETWRRRQFREIGMKHSTLISTRGYSTLTLFPPAVYPSPFTVLPYFYSCVHAPCLRPSIFSKSRVESYANLTLLPAGIRTYSKTLYMGVWLGPERKPTARVARRRALAHMGHLTLPAFLTGVLSPDS